MDDKVRLAVRQAWQCPCDGEPVCSDTRELDSMGMHSAADAILDDMEERTGFRPLPNMGSQCPWAAKQDALVKETQRRWFHRTSNPDGIHPDNIPAILFEAIQAYEVYCKNAEVTFADDDRKKREEERKRKEAEAAAKGNKG